MEPYRPSSVYLSRPHDGVLQCCASLPSVKFLVAHHPCGGLSEFLYQRVGLQLLEMWSGGNFTPGDSGNFNVSLNGSSSTSGGYGSAHLGRPGDCQPKIHHWRPVEERCLHRHAPGKSYHLRLVATVRFCCPMLLNGPWLRCDRAGCGQFMRQGDVRQSFTHESAFMVLMGLCLAGLAVLIIWRAWRDVCTCGLC